MARCHQCGLCALDALGNETKPSPRIFWQGLFPQMLSMTISAQTPKIMRDIGYLRQHVLLVSLFDHTFSLGTLSAKFCRREVENFG